MALVIHVSGTMVYSATDEASWLHLLAEAETFTILEGMTKTVDDENWTITMAYEMDVSH